jgi:hypothetical protein
MVQAELNCVGTGKGRCLAESQLARIVLLKLPGGAHAVIAKPNRDGRIFLSHLECAVAALADI